jgi:hypothetical protein
VFDQVSQTAALNVLSDDSHIVVIELVDFEDLQDGRVVEGSKDLNFIEVEFLIVHRFFKQSTWFFLMCLSANSLSSNLDFTRKTLGDICHELLTSEKLPDPNRSSIWKRPSKFKKTTLQAIKVFNSVKAK